MNLIIKFSRVANIVAISSLLSLLLVSVTWGQPSPATNPPKNDENANVEPAEVDQTGNEDETESADQEPKKPKRVLDLTSPRATMRAFLLAIQQADADRPERIDEAVACIDTSNLEGEDVADRQRSLARRLHSVIDKAGVKLEDIPTEWQENVYEFFKIPTSPASDAKELDAVIALERHAETNRWLFTPKSLLSIPALENHFARLAKNAEPELNALPPERRSPRATITSFMSAMKADPPNLK